MILNILKKIFRRRNYFEQFFEKIEVHDVIEGNFSTLNKKILEIEGFGIIKGFDRCFGCYSKLEGNLKIRFSDNANDLSYFSIICSVCGAEHEVYNVVKINKPRGERDKISYINVKTNNACPYCKKGKLVKQLTMVNNKAVTILEYCSNYMECVNLNRLSKPLRKIFKNL